MNLLNGTPNKVDSPSQVQMLNQVDGPPNKGGVCGEYPGFIV